MKKRIIPLLLCLLLLAGCTPIGTAPLPLENDAQTFIRQVNDGRRVEVESGKPPDLSAYTTDYTGQLDAFTAEEMQAFARGEAPTLTLSRAEAEEDIDALFQLMEYAYAGYDYFGGDAVFNAARQEVLPALPEGSLIAYQKLLDALYQTLAPIIQDGHFALDSTYLVWEHYQWMWYVPDLYFDDTTGLVMDYVKPTVGPDGALTYCFAALSEDGRDLPTMVRLGGEMTPITWVAAEPLPERGSPPYARVEAEGVPVLINRSMGAVDPTLFAEQREDLLAFANSGKEWAKDPVMVLDIRGNTGGQPAFAQSWCEDFSGQRLRPWCVNAAKNTLAVELDGTLPGFYSLLFPALEPAGRWTVSTQEGRWTENENPVFVLMDKTAMSAAEFFIRDLRSMDNVVFVGSNTAGAFLAGGIRSFRLPNSGMWLTFGTMLSPAEDGSNIDGVGYLPDLWVNPPDAQDAVLRLIEHYGLK